jgi:ribonuclease Z
MNRHVPAPADLRVTLLGTGGPELSIDRMGAATLVQAGAQTLLFDAGRSVMQRLYECGVPLNDVTKVFFTHLHSDHIEGLPQLWIQPWFMFGRRTPMEFRGPLGTRDMLAGMRQFMGHDVVHRAHEHSPAEALDFSVEEFEQEGVVYAQGGVTITAVPVDHKDGNPSFGFVIDYAGRRVVISGDCILSEDLIRAGKGADLVVHNVFAPSPELAARHPVMRIVAQKLASPEQTGEVFRRTGARMGAFTHVIRIDSSYDDIIRRTRAAGYDGPLVIGEDRMVFEVGAEIRAIPPNDLNRLAELSAAGAH